MIQSRSLSLAWLLFVALACSSDPEPQSSNGGGAAGAPADPSGGNGGDRPQCVGCGEYITSSDPQRMLCAGMATDLANALFTCFCTACGVYCVECMTSIPSPQCTPCKLDASHAACEAQYAACLADL